MATVFDVPADLLIEEIAKDLRETRKLQQPEFVLYAKSGHHRERAPLRKDWWYVRCASILRRLYIDGSCGTERLRSYYGGRKAFKVAPHHFRKASGKVIRTCLQALEKEGLLKREKFGRSVSGAGLKCLNQTADKVDKIMREQHTLERRAEVKLPELKAAEAKTEKKSLKKKRTAKELSVDEIISGVKGGKQKK